MRRIIVTPAGRKQYLEILFKHLEAQKAHFDEWWLLLNTNTIADIGFCERLAARNESWVFTKYAETSNPNEGKNNIHRLLNEFCADEDAVYIRLDDDICYLAPTFVDDLFEFRIDHPEYFVVLANIVNNPITSWIHNRLGLVNIGDGVYKFDSIPRPEIAEGIHRAFLEKPKDAAWSTAFSKWIATDRERIPGNAFSWFGKSLKEGLINTADEDHWFMVARPQELNVVNAIFGQAVCVHFAYESQRPHLENADLLDRYAELAPKPPAPAPAPVPIAPAPAAAPAPAVPLADKSAPKKKVAIKVV